MNEFEKNLERLAELIKASGDEELTKVFSAFLRSLKTGLKGYHKFLKFVASSIPQGWERDVAG